MTRMNDSDRALVEICIHEARRLSLGAKPLVLSLLTCGGLGAVVALTTLPCTTDACVHNQSGMDPVTVLGTAGGGPLQIEQSRTRNH